MIKYTAIFIFYLSLCSSLNAQEYLLDSSSTYIITQVSGGPNISRGESKFKYDKEKRLISRVNRSTYEIYTYSDEKNTKEDYLTSTNELRFRVVDFLNEDGFIVETIREYINSEGEHFINKIDSLKRDEDNLLTELIQYEIYQSKIKIAKKTIYFRNSEGKVEKEISDIYKKESTLYDDIFYIDTIVYFYEGDDLKEIQKSRYDSMGNLEECTNTRYSYFDDHLVEIIEIAEDDVCGLYTTWTETLSYYSDNEYYAFDSIFVYGFREDGWGLFTERRTADFTFEDDILVEYEGSRLIAPTSQYNGVSFYKKAETLLNSKTINSKLDFELRPNITSANRLINIETEAKTKLKMGIYTVQGALIYSETIVTNRGVQFVAPSAKGTYFVKISDEENKEFTVKKLIVF